MNLILRKALIATGGGRLGGKSRNIQVKCAGFWLRGVFPLLFSHQMQSFSH